MDRRKEREDAKRLAKEKEQYDPRQNSRELNPYWKKGGDGLPSASMFRKPAEEDESYSDKRARRSHHVSSWRKLAESKKEHEDKKQERLSVPVAEEKDVEVLSDKELNALGK